MAAIVAESASGNIARGSSEVPVVADTFDRAQAFGAGGTRVRGAEKSPASRVSVGKTTTKEILAALLCASYGC